MNKHQSSLPLLPGARAESSPATPAWGAWMGTCPGLASAASQVNPGTKLSGSPWGSTQPLRAWEAHKGCLSVREPPPPCQLASLEFWSWLQQHDFCPLRSLLGRLARPAAATHNQLLGATAVRQLIGLELPHCQIGCTGMHTHCVILLHALYISCSLVLISTYSI